MRWLPAVRWLFSIYLDHDVPLNLLVIRTCFSVWHLQQKKQKQEYGTNEKKTKIKIEQHMNWFHFLRCVSDNLYDQSSCWNCLLFLREQSEKKHLTNKQTTADSL